MSLKNNDLRLPQGTADYVGTKALIREEMREKIRNMFRLYSGVPLETPVYEFRKILMDKYGEDEKLVFDLVTAENAEELCLRYDLTVPFARYMAMSGAPFMTRYQMGKVYRRDTPQVGSGRYQEFEQCDFDIAGEYDKMKPEAEILNLLVDILDALDITTYVIKLNNKALLFKLLTVSGVATYKLMTVCSSIDKLDKKPWSEIAVELKTKEISDECITNIQKMISLDSVDKVREKYLPNEKDNELAQILDDIDLLFKYFPSDRIRFDLSLARGLNYYTGTIFETVLTDNIKIGSIAAGGRYDKLIGQYRRAGDVPAIGCSIGFERIFDYICDRTQIALPLKCFVTSLDDDGSTSMFVKSREIVRTLRMSGITCMLNNTSRKMKKLIPAAEEAAANVMIIVGSKEMETGCVQVKNLKTRTQEAVQINSLVEYLNKM